MKCLFFTFELFIYLLLEILMLKYQQTAYFRQYIHPTDILVVIYYVSNMDTFMDKTSHAAILSGLADRVQVHIWRFN